MNRRLCGALLLGAAMMIFLFSAPTATQAQKTVAKQKVKLPSADNVMDDAARAVGSKVAFDKMKTIVMRGKISMPAQNITGSMMTQMQFPDKVYVLQEIAGVGKFEQGYDGKVGWSRDAINGLRTLEGGELRQMKSQSDEVRSSDWRKLYKKPEMLGLRKVGTADAYAIRMTPLRGGKPVITYYDVKTKLSVRTDMVIETAQGSVPTQSFISDYRLVNGVKIPFKTRQVVGGVSEVNVVFDAVQINVPIDGKLFTKPTAPAKKVEAPTNP